MSDKEIIKNGKKKRSRVTARELEALVSDNKQKANQDLPKCPICHYRIEPQYWQLHYQYELKRLNDLESDIYTNPLDNTRGKRGAAIAAKRHLEKKLKKPTSIYQSTLDKVKQNSSHRKQTIDRLYTSRIDSPDLNDLPLESASVQTCFICNQALHGDSDSINLHIDQCLINMDNNNQSTSSDITSSSNNNSNNNNNNNSNSMDHSNQWDEYEWAGQVRVRATSLMEGGYGGAGFATTQKDDDVDDDLDIEEDDMEYGTSQYNELDIMTNLEHEDENELREMVTGGLSKSNFNENEVEDNDDENQSIREGFEETVSTTGWEKHEKAATYSNNNNPGGNLIIDSLKSRIQQLEAESKSISRCLICLEPHKTPVTSIVCWHVHCEKCWLQTLGTKKLCPQCQKITTPADLRRIYL
ncbi:unnamed protein product [Cunninghamella echinulata]